MEKEIALAIFSIFGFLSLQDCKWLFCHSNKQDITSSKVENRLDVKDNTNVQDSQE